VDLGNIRGFKTRFHLYTVPGQVYYNASRRLILKGVDGVVFVGDSQMDRQDANLESMHNLYDNLSEHGLDPRRMPFVIQYNKRDLPNATTLDELESSLNPTGVQSFEAVATRGVGVFDTLKAISKQVIKQLS
jgi:mutual gliding-motility protein MglA